MNADVAQMNIPQGHCLSFEAVDAWARSPGNSWFTFICVAFAFICVSKAF
jgi:hypothetical protein